MTPPLPPGFTPAYLVPVENGYVVCTYSQSVAPYPNVVYDLGQTHLTASPAKAAPVLPASATTAVPAEPPKTASVYAKAASGSIPYHYRRGGAKAGSRTTATPKGRPLLTMDRLRIKKATGRDEGDNKKFR